MLTFRPELPAHFSTGADTAWGNHGIGECRRCRQSYSAGDVWDHWTLRLNDITSDLITEQTGQAHPTALGRSRIFEEGRAAADGTPNPHTDCLSKAAITWLCGYLANDRSAFVAAQIAQAHAEGHSAQPGDNNPYYGRRALAVAWREGYRGALEEWAAEAIERQRRLRERARGEQRSE